MEDGKVVKEGTGLQPIQNSTSEPVDAIEDASPENEVDEARELAELKEKAAEAKKTTDTKKIVSAKPKVEPTGLRPKPASEVTSEADPVNEEQPQDEDGEPENSAPVKKTNLVPQYRLNQYARKLRAVEQELAESKRQHEDEIRQLRAKLSPAGEPKPLTVDEYERREREREIRQAHDARVNEAEGWLVNQKKDLEQQVGADLGDGFYEDIAHIIKDKGWSKEDPRVAVPEALKLWKKENLVEASDESNPDNPQDKTSIEPESERKSPEQIRNEQKAKATPITKTKKSPPIKKMSDYTREELDAMSLEELEKLAGRANKTFSNKVY